MRGLVALVGVVFLAAGLTLLIHPRIKMPPKRSEVRVGSEKMKIETQQILNIPASTGILAMVAGAGLIYMGVRKPG
jgi:hypothetical protein